MQNVCPDLPSSLYLPLFIGRFFSLTFILRDPTWPALHEVWWEVSLVVFVMLCSMFLHQSESTLLSCLSTYVNFIFRSLLWLVSNPHLSTEEWNRVITFAWVVRCREFYCHVIRETPHADLPHCESWLIAPRVLWVSHTSPPQTALSSRHRVVARRRLFYPPDGLECDVWSQGWINL